MYVCGESLCCSLETITTFLIGYTPIQNKKFNEKESLIKFNLKKRKFKKFNKKETSGESIKETMEMVQAESAEVSRNSKKKKKVLDSKENC